MSKFLDVSSETGRGYPTARLPQDVVEGQAALIKACEKTLSSTCSGNELLGFNMV